MDKDYILRNVEDLTAEQLADRIKKNIVTLDELKATDLLDRTKRNAIEEHLRKDEIAQKELDIERRKADDKAWEEVKYSNDKMKLYDWLNAHPNNRNRDKVKKRIDDIEANEERIKAQKQKLLDAIRRNPNSHTVADIRNFLADGTLTEYDLIKECNIHPTVLNHLDKVKLQDLKIGETPRSIPDGYTEVYFWGIPGSGKTCALGAILNMADERGYLTIAPGPGNRYATQLKNIFSDDDVANDFLPAPTPEEITQYLPFTLQKPNEKKKSFCIANRVKWRDF